MESPRERILIVESDPEISDLISRQTLQPLGYNVEVIGAAAAGIQEAARFSPDVILANLNLPGLSGKDLLVALNAQGVDVPVIVIAHKGMEADVIQAFRLGAADFLSWPIREAEVVSAVERVLKQGRARREREQLARQLKQTNQELQRRVRELTTLSAIGKAVISVSDQQSIFNKLLEGAAFLAEADSGWLLIREERNKSFTLRACRNVPPEINARMNQAFDDGLSSLVALSGESLSITGDPLKRFKVSHIGQSVLVIPVKIRKDVFGLLVVARKDPTAFLNSQQALLEAVADYASISLVNSRLYKTLEEKVQLLQQSANNARVDERIKGEILNEVSHELASPLSVIQGNVDMLLGDELGRLNSEQTAVVKIIQEKLWNAMQVVNATTSISRERHASPGAGSSLNELSNQALERFHLIARQAQVKIGAELPTRPLHVTPPATLVARILDGLISNAIKYTPPGGSITLMVKGNPNHAYISVEDTGVGVDARHLPHLFELNYKVSDPPIGRYGGMGIDLPVIKEIIDSHGGKIWAESRPGGGTAFRFTLPIANR